MITAFLAPYIGYIVALLGIVGGLLGIVAHQKGKVAGRNEANLTHAKQENERTEAVLDEIKKQQEIIHRAGNITRDDVDRSLSEGKF